MAYNTKELFDKALKVIDKDGLYFLSDVHAYLGISSSTFYDHFPSNSSDSSTLKEKLEANKVKTKVELRAKLHNSGSTSGILALYKLICTNDERKALSMVYNDHTTKGDPISIPPIHWVDSEDQD